MLAGELAATPDHTAAFAAYERDTREFVELNQALVSAGDAALLPVTEEALAQRNAALRGLSSRPEATDRSAHTALTLPSFISTT